MPDDLSFHERGVAEQCASARDRPTVHHRDVGERDRLIDAAALARRVPLRTTRRSAQTDQRCDGVLGDDGLAMALAGPFGPTQSVAQTKDDVAVRVQFEAAQLDPRPCAWLRNPFAASGDVRFRCPRRSTRHWYRPSPPQIAGWPRVRRESGCLQRASGRQAREGHAGSISAVRRSLCAGADPRDVHAVIAPVDSLGPASYKVEWRVVSADGHPVDGIVHVRRR